LQNRRFYLGHNKNIDKITLGTLLHWVQVNINEAET
jgi:hypothetical protein